MLDGFREKTIIFTAGTGRAGTTSIARFFQTNVESCVAEHEPPPLSGSRLTRAKNLLLGRPNYKFYDKGFGKALEWYDVDDRKLDEVILKKAARIRDMECRVYLEASHSFLKSTCDGLAAEFPDLGLIHLTREPLEVAKSYCNRVVNPKEPRFEKWSPLPGFRKNCLKLDDEKLSALQRFLWMWIEVELRFVRFIERNPEISFIDLDTRQLNDEGAMNRVLDSFSLERKSKTLVMLSPENKNSVNTKVTDEDLAEAKALLELVPLNALEKLRNPYQLLDLKNARY